MIEVSRSMPVRPERVYGVLADGWTYAGWVVGNAHIRDVDASWPAEGSRIHHKAGLWPVQVPDVSLVTAVVPNRMIELTARLWVLGRARIRLTLTPEGEHGTEVTMGEEVVSGPASLLPEFVQAVLLKPRNVETLARLEDIAVNRRSGGGGDSGPASPPGDRQS